MGSEGEAVPSSVPSSVVVAVESEWQSEPGDRVGIGGILRDVGGNERVVAFSVGKL